MLKRKLLLFSLASVAVVVAATAYWLRPLWSPDVEIYRKPLERITSPGGEVDAVLVECHGTLSLGYEVYLVPKGKRLPNDRKESILFSGRLKTKGKYGPRVA